MKIIPNIAKKITSPNGEVFRIKIDGEGYIYKKITPEAPDWWINSNIKTLEDSYRRGVLPWTFH